MPGCGERFPGLTGAGAGAGALAGAGAGAYVGAGAGARACAGAKFDGGPKLDVGTFPSAADIAPAGARPPLQTIAMCFKQLTKTINLCNLL